jgi:hypothetical protein
VDRSPAQDLEQFVADLLEPQALLDNVPVVGRQAQAALVAEEIGGRSPM